MTDALPDRIVEELRAAPKYRHLCPDTLTRIAAWAAARHTDPKTATKAAKRKLHQVYAAYLDPGSVARVQRLVDALPESPSESVLEAACRQILAAHASTRERLPILETVFREVFAAIGPIHSILDAACGLSPFALPWMNLPRGVRYEAIDIDARLIAMINTFFVRIGREPAAVCGDILTSAPDRPVDAALLLKSLPCIEQQEKGGGLALLERLRARWVVVSFPVTSLGGAGKGMREHYDTLLNQITAALDVRAQQYCYATETLYLLQMHNDP